VPRHSWTLQNPLDPRPDGFGTWVCDVCKVAVRTRNISGPRWTYAETWTAVGQVIALGRYDKRPSCPATPDVVASAVGTGARDKRRAPPRKARADSVIPSDEAALLQRLRPRNRSECRGGQRPCPWYGCRHHLGLDVSPSGGMKVSVIELEDMDDTCSLDVADRVDAGDVALDQVGELLGVSTERARQIEWNAMGRLREVDGLSLALRVLTGKSEDV